MIDELESSAANDGSHRQRIDSPEALRAHARHLIATQPPLGSSIRKDGVRFAAMRGERFEFDSNRAEWMNALRLVFASDDFAGVALYRLRCMLRRRGVPVLPWIVNRICILFFGIRIGDRVLIREGLYLPHGNVIIDGVIEIGGGCTICPWVTIGLKQGSFVGPVIEGNVFIGTGAKILGDIHIGPNANIGAGAVVVTDIPANSNAAGVPARARPHTEGE